jgi:hypothetical protein
MRIWPAGFFSWFCFGQTIDVLPMPFFFFLANFFQFGLHYQSVVKKIIAYFSLSCEQ